MLSFAARNAYTRYSATLMPRSVTVTRLVSQSAVHDGNPEVLDTEKRRNLEKKQHLTSTTHEEHAPGWNEYLASSSEANVKADRLGQDGPPTTDLTERTLRHLKLRHHGGSREEASYERDEVQGPLKNSTTGATDDVSFDEKFKDKQGTTPSEDDVRADRGEAWR
ncbi:hypothetical protein JB92DRAFT_3106532 [Gautieria morchelliformis]|nr:hypothetical protein JB92DRAFT_3106532 [Gautieria morchelliformis]